MSFLEKIQEFDKKFAWSFFGFALALIFGLLTIYVSFFYEKKPVLKYEIVSNTSVLDVRENISKLDVFYDGKDIKNNRQALRILLVRIVNDGNESILKKDYDENDPIGFVVPSGQLIKSEIISASNQYLEDNIKLIVQPRGKVSFSSVIIEPKEHFMLKLLVLVKEGDKELTVQSVGKLAGLKSIEVVESYREQETAPFLTRAFEGSITVQIVRFMAYFFASLIVIVLIVILSIIVGEQREKRIRLKIVRGFKEVSDINFTKCDEYVFNKFLEHGDSYLSVTHELLSNTKKLQRAVRDSKNLKDSEEIDSLATNTRLLNILPISEIVKSCLIKKKGTTFEINEHTKTTFESFIDYYEKKRAKIVKFTERTARERHR